MFSVPQGDALWNRGPKPQKTVHIPGTPPLFDFVSKHSGKVIPERIPSPYFCPTSQPYENP
ncbi:hypothetical protein HMPREF1545_02631 [Oscillibacter sp. KLE 1728]|nr:hypothetical protein HMPREF1545_02631 [Oscillibacter sp. KLE 1728]ERK59695.1 hypothetical protein HMPREF1546_03283 [Oscillibacter sp. KLE 1745]